MADENESNAPEQPEQPEGEAPQGDTNPAEEAVEQAEAKADEAAAEAGSDGAEMSEEEAKALEAAMAAVGGAVSAGGAVASGDDDGASGATPFEAPELTSAVAGGGAKGLDLLADVHMNVRIELGRTSMYVEDVLRLDDGSVVELDKLAGDPVDVFVNNRKVARGEVLVLNDNFCVRISEILDLSES